MKTIKYKKYELNDRQANFVLFILEHSSDHNALLSNIPTKLNKLFKILPSELIHEAIQIAVTQPFLTAQERRSFNADISFKVKKYKKEK